MFGYYGRRRNDSGDSGTTSYSIRQAEDDASSVTSGSSMNSPTRSTNYDATGTENGDTLKCRACGERHADPSDTTSRRPSCRLHREQQVNAVS